MQRRDLSGGYTSDFSFKRRLTRAPFASSTGSRTRLSQGKIAKKRLSAALIAGNATSRCRLPQRSRTACATSSAVLIGCDIVRSATTSRFDIMKLVSIGPGDTSPVFMSVPRSSSKSAYVKVRKPALTAEYVAWSASGCRPARDPTLMIAPVPFSCKYGSTSLLNTIGALRFTSTIEAWSSADTLSKDPR